MIKFLSLLLSSVDIYDNFPVSLFTVFGFIMSGILGFRASGDFMGRKRSHVVVSHFLNHS